MIVCRNRQTNENQHHLQNSKNLSEWHSSVVHSLHSQQTDKVNRELRSFGKKLELNITLTTYVARHSFATVLKRSGVNIGIISESLGHSDLATTQIYLDSFENSQIDEAMKNLL